MVDSAVIKGLVFSERDQMLHQQISGCLLSRAALNGVDRRGMKGFVSHCIDDRLEGWRERPDWTTDRLNRARARFGAEAMPDPLERWTTHGNKPREP